MSGGVTFEFDKGQLAALGKKLSPDLAAEALENAATDLTHIAQAAAMEATPVKTGTARRQTVTEAHAVVGRYPYLNWLDKGTDSRGRQMVSRPGGYQLRKTALDAAKAAAPQVLDKCGREIAARWAD